MLPIALKSFHIKNYRGIIDTQIDNIPPNTQWIFLTGENGFGKTSVLQGIALLNSKPHNVGLSEKFNLEFQVYKDNVVIEFSFSPFIIATSANGRTPPKIEILYLSELKEIVAYGSTRLRVSPHSSKEVLTNNSNVDSLFSNDILLADIEEKFKDWYSNYRNGFDEIEKLFKVLLPRLGKISAPFNYETKESEVKYFEIDSKGDLIEEGVDFNNLAAGYRNIIATVGDMIFRLGTVQNFKNYNDLEGIVIIDEFELHLHPVYQKLFVQKLTELFPKIQFIVSTHSPIPLLGAPKNSVIINVSRTREEGIKAELLEIDFSVLTPNAILSSPIFGFQDLIPESKSDDKMIRTEDTFQEVEFNDQLKKNINQFLTKERQEELLKLIKVKQKS